MRVIGALFLCVLAACAPREWRRDYDRLLGADESASVFVVRDGRTGQPVENATVKGYLEWALTDDGKWAPLVHEGKTDEFGVVRFPTDPQGPTYHWVVEAPGYAPAEEFGRVISEVVDLLPGRDYRARVLDPFGEPVQGMEIEYKVGCAHAPALRTVRTDERGVFVVSNIHADGDLCFSAPGCMADYWSAPMADIGHDRTYVMVPTYRIRGRLLDRTGRPFKRAVLQAGTRGPLVTCEPDGSFVIDGAQFTGSMPVFAGEHFGDVHINLEKYRPGGPFTVFLGAPDPPLEKPASVRGVHDGQVVICDVHLDRVSDGRRYTNAGKVPSGEYVVSAGDTFSRYVATPRRWTGEHRIPVVEQPRLRVKNHGEERMAVVANGRMKGVPDKGERPLHLPADARAVVRVKTDVEHFFPVGPARDGVREATVLLPKPTRVVLPKLDDDVIVFPPDWDNERAFETWRTGLLRIVLLHDTLGVARYEFRARPGRTVRLPKPRWVAPAQVRVLDPDGGENEAPWVTPVLGRGTPYWEAEIPRPGMTVRIGDGVHGGDQPYVSFVHELEGNGPFTVQFGTCGIDIPGPSTVVIDGDRRWGNPVRLRGIRPGWHTLLVQPEKKKGFAMRIHLKPGETRVIEP